MTSTGEFAAYLSVVLGLYAVLLVLLAGVARKHRKLNDVADHYLAGRDLGLAVIVFTLFATKYSGNTLLGFPGQAYRDGLQYYMSVTFVTGVVVGQMLLAPRLHRLSKQHSFLTPTDFLMHRFGSRPLKWLVTGVYAFTLLNFLLAQHMAMGHLISGVTNGAVPYGAGVATCAVTVLTYERLGGMRAIAWTDVIQGGTLLLGILVSVGLVFWKLGPPGAVIELVVAASPGKVQPPDLRTCSIWTSAFALLCFGGPVYPQAIQRVFAAKSASELKRAFAVMAFLPHVIVGSVFFVGIAGIVLAPDLVEPDRVTVAVLGSVIGDGVAAKLLLTVIVLAIFAAILSTADSCLLSLSSITVQDVVRTRLAKGSEELLRYSLPVNCMIIGAVAAASLFPLSSLWELLVIKYEVLVQLSPAFMFGTSLRPAGSRRAESAEVIVGVVVGLLVTGVLHVAGYPKLVGIHAGVVALCLNYLVVVIGTHARTTWFERERR